MIQALQGGSTDARLAYFRDLAAASFDPAEREAQLAICEESCA